MLPERHFEVKQPSFAEFSRRYEVLLQSAEKSAGRALSDLFRELLQYLRELFEFNFVHYALHDGFSEAMRVFVVDENGLLFRDAMQFPVQDAPSGWVVDGHVPR